MNSIILNTYARMIDIFDLIPDEDIVRRSRLSHFMRSEQVRQIENAINEQALIAIKNDDPTASARVEEGMLYLEKLFLSKVKLNAVDRTRKGDRS